MDALTDLRTSRVVIMSCVQIGKTEIILNSIGRAVHIDPGPSLFVLPNLNIAENYSVNRFAPMVRDTPVLRSIVAEAKSRSGANKKLSKSYRGGYLDFAGAESPGALAGRPIRYLYLDEVDRYPMSAGTEGDPVELALKRTSNFWNKKELITSTPGHELTSRVYAHYLQSTMELFYTPCPDCGHLQTMVFGNFIFKSLLYKCERCEKKSEKHEWHQLQKGGEWRETCKHDKEDRPIDEKGNPITTRGFHVNFLLSPWVNWEEVRTEYHKAVRQKEGGDFSSMMVFHNTRLGNPWEDLGLKADINSIMSRREPYKSQLPAGVKFLTAGIDVQDQRLEYSVVGWGDGRENWHIETGKIWGRTALDDVWKKLDEQLYDQTWKTAEGVELQCQRIFVDSHGHSTSRVYQYTKARSPRVFSSRGVGGPGLHPIHMQNLTHNGTPLVHLGVDGIKGTITTHLHVDKPGPGYCHFPILDNGTDHPGFDLAFFQALCAESQSVRFLRGFKKFEWNKQPHQANEAWDCFVYAYAAMVHYIRDDSENISRMELPMPKVDKGNTIVQPEAETKKQWKPRWKQ